ncbi:CRE-HCP-3 protein [Caenorhabditis remanei]|uniref:CRE-HCP-3 protein n=2 Tax=Caenorhabditis remanei TaxID=31234 RepID=E3LSA9_CAERE|nr:CRE-HCP-3 protein [Caenorhabditis remanei]
MHHNGPRIEEMVDPPSRSTTNQLKNDTEYIKSEYRRISHLPDFNRDPELIQEVMNLTKRYIEKWLREERDEPNMERQGWIERFKTKLREWETKKETAEDEYYTRRDASSNEEKNREIARRRATDSQMNITGLHDSTRLNQQSYSRSYENRNRRYSSDEDDDENMAPQRRQRSRSPPSFAHHQRRDDTGSYYRSHHTQNSSNQRTHNTDFSSHYRGQYGPSTSQNVGMPSNAQNVRMRSGKSRVTKTRSRKWRPGQRALEEIRKYQKSTDMLIQKAPFARLVHEIMREATSESQDFRIRADALMALQEAAEAFMVEMFEGSVLICNHAKRVTLMPTDIQLYRRLCLRNLS